MQTEINHHGYSITLKSIPSHFLENIKTELTVKPIENPNFLGNSIAFPVYRLSKNKIYLPRYYGIEKYNQCINHLKSSEPINVTFNGTLRDIQEHTIKETLIAFEKFGGGIISLDTGLGKTVVALKLINLMKQKTLIVVHAEFLLEQWVARIKQFLPDARIGIIRQERCEIENVDITVGMLQTIINRDISFKDYGLMAIDECFPYNQLIWTSDGITKIGTIYNKWKKNQKLPLILSFNEQTKQTEYKKIVYAWEKINENLLKINYSKSNFKCTENHKILTPNGYIEANKLNIGDLITCNYNDKLTESMVAQALNEDQYQILLGSYLGDGHISILPSERYRLKIIHCEKQKEYCEWKASMFNCSIKRIENNGYAKGIAYNFCTKIIDLPNNKKFTKEYNYCPQWVLDDLDYRGIAIWWMDDGSLNKRKTYGTLSTCSFDEESHIRIIKRLKQLDIDCIYRQDGKGYLSIYFRKNEIINLLEKINPYLCENMKYKFSFTETLYKWDTKFLNYGTVKITSVISIKNESKFVYDIEVEDNHNFICSSISGIGPIVHNCHHVCAKSFSNLFYKVQTRYLIGLSATPIRKDGLSKILYWFLGPQIVDIKRETDKPSIQFINTDIKFYVEKFNKLGKINSPTMITDLTKNINRNELIKNTILSLKDRKILFLSDRREHCETMFNYCKDYVTAGLYLGGMKTDARELTTTFSVIFGTYQACGEGFDVPELDTLILATPKSDVEQAVGRILRQKNKNEPLILDFVDTFSIFKGQFYKRKKFYKSKEFKIK